MTTLTVSDDWDVESSEQAASDAVVTVARSTARVRFTSGPQVSSKEIGHVDGDGAGGTARGARAAVPTLVDMHEGLAVLGVDGQRVERTDLDTQRAALDTQRLVNGHWYVDALIDLGHQSPLTRLLRR